MSTFPTSNELNELVDNFFASRKEEVSYDPASGTGTYGDAIFSVHNLAANLAKIDRERWPDYVAWHFGHLDDGPPELPTSYEEVRRRLRVRLASEAWVEALPYREIARPVADDLYEVLMVSIDHTAATVPPDSLETWGEPLDTLWADARENTLWEEPRERRTLVRPGGEQITWVRGSWWVASLLLDLGRYLSPRNPYGALVMVPVRDALLFHEIADEKMVTALAGLAEAGLMFYMDGPDSISPHIYWWQNGEIRQVVAFENDSLNPVWGKDFKRMLADLDSTIGPARVRAL